MSFRSSISAALLALIGSVGLAGQASAQDTLPGARITNAGVVRANAITDSVFIRRTRLIDTVEIADFTSLMLAQIGAPPFDDSLAFKVTSDLQRIRISGRIMDFPPENRAELGPIFSFLDSTSVFVAEISMPRADSGILVFKLERVTVRGFAIPEVMMLAAVAEYRRRYPTMLFAGGTQFHVEIPREARVTLIRNALVLKMPPKP
jgi:hypothetical protein